MDEQHLREMKSRLTPESGMHRIIDAKLASLPEPTDQPTPKGHDLWDQFFGPKPVTSPAPEGRWEVLEGGLHDKYGQIDGADPWQVSGYLLGLEAEVAQLTATIKRQRVWAQVGMKGAAEDNKANADKLVAIDQLVADLEAEVAALRSQLQEFQP